MFACYQIHPLVTAGAKKPMSVSSCNLMSWEALGMVRNSLGWQALGRHYYFIPCCVNNQAVSKSWLCFYVYVLSIKANLIVSYSKQTCWWILNKNRRLRFDVFDFPIKHTRWDSLYLNFIFQKRQVLSSWHDINRLITSQYVHHFQIRPYTL